MWSTNGVLHLLAMAGTAGVDLSLDDFQRVSNRIPFIANMAPSGKYLMADLYDIGGIPSVMKLLIAGGLLDGSVPTITGKTLAENVAPFDSLPQGQEIIRSLDNPIKPTGHIEILRGNLAPEGAVAKITGKEGMSFTGKARVFNKEHELDDALNKGQIPRHENLVIVVRYEGPKGGPGMPEQLKASAAIMGAKLTNVALITDGRYSGASHGFIVGHICPEAAVGGPIAVVQDGDMITIDATNNTLSMDVSEEEIKQRLKEWKKPRSNVTRGVLAKYQRLVGDASHGKCLKSSFTKNRPLTIFSRCHDRSILVVTSMYMKRKATSPKPEVPNADLDRHRTIYIKRQKLFFPMWEPILYLHEQLPPPHR
ncbi:dihydroxy-acid and 6-phosphogluconate dehydratase [Aureobasidium pullulans]|uniref:dihydroxy-acid dehydratase n=1 Tax=Aureobasidium pullulans TaxID=5580 RepID=A0A4T0CKX6_AURPU|nr:dihydroxy-acid and 6-phosphogluconate dehydratase [Aureobasidium pullulans]